MIGDDIEVTVLAIMGEKVRLGIRAPREVPVFRTEVYVEIQHERGGAPGEGDPESAQDVRAEVDAALRRLGSEADEE